MCGIVGYVGDTGAKKVILDGLKKLEYRGYDSSGIALNINNTIAVKKCKGRIAELEAIIGDEPFDSGCGIGHTRWATHGEPSDINAHPHISNNGQIAVVHNGIIENYEELKKELVEQYDVTFSSDTDTEVIAHLLSVCYEGDLLQAIYKAVEKMRGAYAIAAIVNSEPDKIVAVRKDSPMVVGISHDANYVASDIPALLRYVREIYLIENNETVVITKDGVDIYNADKKPVYRDVFHVTWDADSAEKDGYDHFMLKEMHEQPKGIGETLRRRIDGKEIVLDGINLTKEELDGFDRVYIVACGTAYHAGLIGKYAIEKFAKIPVEVDIASEFRYREPFLDDKTLFIAISQSGETLDTLAALRCAKEAGARILSIVNVVGSSVARESDDVFYTWAGPEIAVASTKAYTTQLMCLYLIAIYMGRLKGLITDEQNLEYIDELSKIPSKIQKIISKEANIAELAKKIYKTNQVFFIGRGIDSSVSFEGSLKLKEISYINSFAIAAGELKHGTIALIEQDTLVVAVATQQPLYEKMMSNIQEVKTRGARVIGLTQSDNTGIESTVEHTLYIPNCAKEFTPLLSIVPLQILSYYIAKLRGCDIDKPKNLAKSVTVE